MRRKNVLAEGEVTGHAHVAVAVDVGVVGRPDDEVIKLEAPNGTDVIHEEHGRISLPPGDYERTFVQRYDHFEEAAVRVVD